MTKGITLSIGLNSVDPKHYGGWSGDLNACEADAADVADIAKSRGFKTETLLTKAATRKNVIQAFGKAAGSLKAGDIFLLFYSGHGGQVPCDQRLIGVPFPRACLPFQPRERHPGRPPELPG